MMGEAREGRFQRVIKKLADFLDTKLAQPMARISNQKHLRAIRDGIVATLPIIVVSSALMIVAFLGDEFPNCALKDWWVAHKVMMLLPYRMGMFIMALYATFGIGYSLSKSYKLDGLSGGILSVLAFMMTIYPQAVGENGSVITNAITLDTMGTSAVFVSIITAILAVEIYRFTQRSGFHIRMPKAVPESVVRSFEALTPTALVFFLVGALCMWVRFDIRSVLSYVINPMLKITDTLPAALLLTFLIMFFWSFGIHGDSVIGPIVRPLWLTLLNENMEAHLNGGATHIAPEQFYQWFVQIGGSGCTIGIAILMFFFARSEYLKSVGKTTFIPAIFNINEPIVFGVPMVLNPILLIPFILTPLIAVTLTWIVMALHIVSPIIAQPPWTLPGPVGAFLACGADWKAAVWCCIIIVLSVFIYLPFFKLYDRQLLKEEEANRAQENDNNSCQKENDNNSYQKDENVQIENKTENAIKKMQEINNNKDSMLLHRAINIT